MAKIIVEVGLPASGKSTCARNRLAKGSFIRINRDDIRTMGFGMQKWSPQREKWVVACEQAMIEKALLEKMIPIVDSTNLTQKRLEFFNTYAKQLGDIYHKELGHVKVELCDHRDVPLMTCVERDSHREGTARVGRVIIEKLAAQAGMFKTDKKVVLCDVDGTLADLTERKKWLEQPSPNWHEFFREVGSDKPIQSTVDMVIDFKSKGYEVWVVSGRPVFAIKSEETLRVGDATVAWLDLNKIPYDHIFMRDGGDHRPDTDAKKDILNHQILKNITKEQIECVIDDRPSVIRMWQENGLKVIDVGDGIDF